MIAVTVRWGDYKQMDVAGGDEGNDGGAEEEEKQGDAGNPPKAKTMRGARARRRVGASADVGAPSPLRAFAP